MTTPQYDAAVKRVLAAGGTWPPKTADTPVKRWPGTGRYKPLPCRYCGRMCEPTRRWCESCSAVLP